MGLAGAGPAARRRHRDWHRLYLLSVSPPAAAPLATALRLAWPAAFASWRGQARTAEGSRSLPASPPAQPERALGRAPPALWRSDAAVTPVEPGRPPPGGGSLRLCCLGYQCASIMMPRRLTLILQIKLILLPLHVARRH